MNIFILDRDPVIAAQSQFNKHIVKMTLESAQILSTITGRGYKPTHANHPCVKWAAFSKSNFDWLVQHSLAIADEYTYRYGKIHKSKAIIELCSSCDIPDYGLTDFALAMPEEFRGLDAVQAYRSYYGSKKDFAVWTKREPPSWWIVH
jgi:hypothetical protein